MDARGRSSHFVPRTRHGRIASFAFALVFLLAMPPLTHTVLNRAEPAVLGVPFFLVSLGVVYTVLIGILVWAFRRDV